MYSEGSISESPCSGGVAAAGIGGDRFDASAQSYGAGGRRTRGSTCGLRATRETRASTS
jgi:hypothetical protein